MELISLLIALVLLGPFFAWGIYLLRRQFRYHEEVSPAVQAVTLTAVGLFFLTEWALTPLWLPEGAFLFVIFAALGLAVAAAALYGPTFVSLAAHLAVDVIMPLEHPGAPGPKYGPAEALERQGDYEGALEEYLVIARIFPRDALATTRIADNLIKLGRPEQAVKWFERGLALLDSAEKCLPVTNRLFEVYSRQLNRPDDGLRILKAYAARFPDGPYAEAVARRIQRLTETRCG